MMSALGVAFDAVSADADAQRKDGHTVMFVAIEGRPAGLIGVASERALAGQDRTFHQGQSSVAALAGGFNDLIVLSVIRRPMTTRGLLAVSSSAGRRFESDGWLQKIPASQTVVEISDRTDRPRPLGSVPCPYAAGQG
jgi:hypothetical protein